MDMSSDFVELLLAAVGPVGFVEGMARWLL